MAASPLSKQRLSSQSRRGGVFPSIIGRAGNVHAEEPDKGLLPPATLAVTSSGVATASDRLYRVRMPFAAGFRTRPEATARLYLGGNLANTPVHTDGRPTAAKISFKRDSRSGQKEYPGSVQDDAEKASTEQTPSAAVVAHSPGHRYRSQAAGRYESRGGRRPVSLWTLATTAIALVVSLPILSVLWLAFHPRDNIWPHLLDTVLGHYLGTTGLLMSGVALGTLSIGVPTAWFVTHYDFPLRRSLNWALLLPFAVPAYVVAYLYTDLLEYAGPVQQFIRTLGGWQLARDYWFPDIRSVGGAVFMMTLVMYPYVYLLARAAFLEQSASVLEASSALGVSRRRAFFHVALPMARPAIAVGLAMAMMETLNDYGTVDYFAVRTLSVGLYDTWLGMNNLGGAAQIATLMLLIVIALLFLERRGRRGRQHFQPSSTRFRTIERRRLQGRQRWLITGFCLLPVLFGFLVPALLLVNLAIDYFAESWTSEFRRTAVNTFMLAALAALSTVLVGTVLSYSLRLQRSRWLDTAVSVSSLGYAVPGAVLAIGVIIPFAAFDNAVDAVVERWFGISLGLLLSGTIVALVFAYTVRFLAVAYGSIDASMRKISPHMDDAARSLGHGSGSILRRVHLPLMQGGVLTAALVVFVDCMKELPATLLLRPFNFDTLATHVYQYASDELIGQASLGALLIVAAGLLPVILLSRTIDRTRELKAAGMREVGSAIAPPVGHPNLGDARGDAQLADGQ